MKTHTPTGTERLAAWTITQLATACREDLTQCTSTQERQNCIACTTADMRRLRDEATAAGRKLSPGELATLAEYGVATPAQMARPLPAA